MCFEVHSEDNINYGIKSRVIKMTYKLIVKAELRAGSKAKAILAGCLLFWLCLEKYSSVFL